MPTAHQVDDRGRILMPREILEILGVKSGDLVVVRLEERKGRRVWVSFVPLDVLMEEGG